MPYHRIRDPEILQALLDAVLLMEGDIEIDVMLRRFVDVACSLVDARYGALGVMNEDGSALTRFVTCGLDEEEIEAIGEFPQGRGLLGLLILEPKPIRLAVLSEHPNSAGFPPGHPLMTSFLGVPVCSGDRVFGNLYLADKIGAPEFSEEDEEEIMALAAAAGVVVRSGRLHEQLRSMSMVEDRARIARDLHDTVVQRLFGTGLALQASLTLVADEELRQRLDRAVGDIDDIIRQVRTTIFALEPPLTAERGVRAQVYEICAEAARTLGFEPQLVMSGPIDATVGGEAAVSLLATLRESLANVARHAQARSVRVELRADDDVVVEVVDDGVGLSRAKGFGGRGLVNMAERAERLGGSYDVATGPKGGTAIRWRVPIR